MRSGLLTFAFVVLSGCAGDSFATGRGSTGAMSVEPDPFALLDRTIPMGVRLDLAAARVTSSGPAFDAILRHLVRNGGVRPTPLALDVLAATDVAVLGLRPGDRREDTAEVLIVRGQYAGLDIESRFAAEVPVDTTEHRGRRVLRNEDVSLALLDDHLLVLGGDGVVGTVIDRYVDRAPVAPGSPAGACPWDVEDALFVAVVTPTESIRDELRRTPPLASIAASFERSAVRVVRTPGGARAEIELITTSRDDASALVPAIDDQIAELARDPYVDVYGGSVLLRALRTRAEGGEVRIVGEATDDEVSRFLRAMSDDLCRSCR